MISIKHIGVFLLFLIVSCSSSESQERLGKSQSIHNLFKLNDAEKILGEPAHLADSATSSKKGTTIYNCSFIANGVDKNTGLTGGIYFMFEDYSEINSAKRIYSSIKKSNESNGIKVLEGLGDEAYFHSDDKNFLFILARKGGKVMRMKVNKITSNTSLDEFNKFAKDVVTIM